MVSPAKGGRVLHVTQPHGQHSVILVEDKATDAGQRIYNVTDMAGGWLSFTGWELESLYRWWREEKVRNGTDEDLP